MTAASRILVAGIGNIFLGDDAFGVRVAEVLLRRQWPAGVSVFDFGIRGIDLAYKLMEDWDATILVDAVPHGNAPGTLYKIEPELCSDAADPVEGVVMQGHSMDPATVLHLVRSMGGRLRNVTVVGCEPTPLDEYDEMMMELSPPVRAAIEPAASMVESMVTQLLAHLTPEEARHEHEQV